MIQEYLSRQHAGCQACEIVATGSHGIRFLRSCSANRIDVGLSKQQRSGPCLSQLIDVRNGRNCLAMAALRPCWDCSIPKWLI
jgi:hypothetical protein